MNPILLKPNTNGTSQVIVRGKVWKTLSPREYYRCAEALRAEVRAAYEELARQFEVVVIEGAGSVTELNLRHVDIVNLDLAVALGAPWVLVADIERGGLFAAVAGTVALLNPSELERFEGVLVNKFRGDVTLFDEGRDLLETRCGARCRGVFPFVDDIDLDSEDSLAVATRPRHATPSGAAIAIVRLPALSNATDFKLLTWADWIATPVDRAYDFVILPGTKDTIGAIEWLRDRGLDAWILRQHACGATVIGVCGGFQIIGELVRDPDGVEARGGEVKGLGLLPVETVLTREKTTRSRVATTAEGRTFPAYEIHLGVTTSREPLVPFATLEDGAPEGARHGRVCGTYLHGALESAAVCRELFGVNVPERPPKMAHYAKLAEWFDAHATTPRDWVPACK